MSKNRKTKKYPEVVSVRFSSGDLNMITAEAEKANTSVADIIRKSWQEYLLQKNVNESLISLEQRLVRKTFEIVAAVAGIDDQERLIALKKFKSRLKQEATK